MSDIFISYSKQVLEPTVALADELTQPGFQPWYDVNLLPAQFFGKVIDDAIDCSQAVVTIWSQPSITSKWVPAESARALAQDKLICLHTKEIHSLKIYHRDVKPGNIILTDKGKPTLIDFGAARQHLGERSNTVIESPGYTAFELLETRGNVGPWSDFYG